MVVEQAVIKGYDTVAEKLTNWEVHQYQLGWDRSMTFKQFSVPTLHDILNFFNLSSC